MRIKHVLRPEASLDVGYMAGALRGIANHVSRNGTRKSWPPLLNNPPV
jgi:hypothetical protein